MQSNKKVIFGGKKKMNEKIECHKKTYLLHIVGGSPIKRDSTIGLIGYCHFYKHLGFLTKAIRKQHNCCRKNNGGTCSFYESRKNNEAVYEKIKEIQSLQAIKNGPTIEKKKRKE
jgi:hypothetical protein